MPAYASVHFWTISAYCAKRQEKVKNDSTQCLNSSWTTPACASVHCWTTPASQNTLRNEYSYSITHDLCASPQISSKFCVYADYVKVV